jgi:hypothetical protein
MLSSNAAIEQLAAAMCRVLDLTGKGFLHRLEGRSQAMVRVSGSSVHANRFDQRESAARWNDRIFRTGRSIIAVGRVLSATRNSRKSNETPCVPIEWG